MKTVQPLDVFQVPLAGMQLVEASAGTGKTWNLCGLYLRLLLEQRCSVQQVLVVTFTKAATAELRERIRSRIAETLAHLGSGAAIGGDPFVPTLLESLLSRGFDAADMRLRLNEALLAFDEAAIFTIHGFCQRALADTPFSTRLPMQVELLEDDGALRAEVVHDFWRRRVADRAIDPLLAAALVQKKDTPQSFDALLKRRLAKPLAQLVWPAGIDATPGLDDSVAAQALQRVRTLWLNDREGIVQVLRRGLSQLNATTYKAEAIEAAALEWDEWVRAGAPGGLLTMAGKRADLFGRARLEARTKKTCTTPRHEFFDAAQDLLDALSALKESLRLHRLRLIRDLLDEGTQALREAKRRRRVTAFDDMLFNLHQRLQGDGGAALAASLRARFPAALIDEFQDTDPLQFGTFERLYGGSDSTLFLLGDPKQAIYSFRNADLHTYLQAKQATRTEYTLLDNQRSSAPLLAGINALFSVHPAAFMQAGLDFLPALPGSKPRPEFSDCSAPRAALQLWRLPARGQRGEPLLGPEALRAAVQATAAEIARLLAAARRGEVQHAGRPLAAGDIAVLVRTHRQGALVRQALAALDIGCVELSQASVFDSAEAQDLERVLAAIAEPVRERLLRAALASLLMGRSAGDILALADDDAQLLPLVERFAGYRETWLQHGVATLLRRWMTEEQVAARLLARNDGPRRLTNLLHLAELLHQASGEHAAPEALLQWLAQQRQQRRQDDAAQLRLESDQDLVQIVTVHKSKGLEYPVVFCPLLWQENKRPAGGIDGIELHDAEGRGVIDFRDDTDPGFDSDTAKAALRLEADAETLRLIYVALTRAVQRFYLVVGCPARRYGRSYSRKEGSANLLNWLVAGRVDGAATWRGAPADADAVLAAWERLASEHAPQVGLAELPAGPGVALPPPDAAMQALAALPAPTVAAPWRIGSYSSLVHGAAHDAAAIDHDQRSDTAEAETGSEQPAGANDILDFPRGPVAGECLHTLFEQADFSAPTSWAAAATAALHKHRAGLPADTEPGRHTRMLQRLLADVTEVPLALGTPTPLRLATLAPERRIVEMEFHLPSRQLTANALNAWLADAGLAVPALAFGSLRGFLKGFIDLVFEHEGRWFVLDWKSNHLGRTARDYGQPAMQTAMHAHGYTLQALLYCVALDRLLRLRLPDYDPAQHLGGAVYLFVRGLRPGWRDAGGAPCGLWLQRPPATRVRQLSDLLAGQEAHA